MFEWLKYDARRFAYFLCLACASINWAAAAGALNAADSAKTYRNPILFADYSDPGCHPSGNGLLHGRVQLSLLTRHPGTEIPGPRALDLIAHALPRLDFHPNYDLPGPIDFNDASERARFNEEMGDRYSAGVWAPAIPFQLLRTSPQTRRFASLRPEHDVFHALKLR